MIKKEELREKESAFLGKSGPVATIAGRWYQGRRFGGWYPSECNRSMDGGWAGLRLRQTVSKVVCYFVKAISIQPLLYSWFLLCFYWLDIPVSYNCNKTQQKCTNRLSERVQARGGGLSPQRSSLSWRSASWPDSLHSWGRSDDRLKSDARPRFQFA